MGTFEPTCIPLAMSRTGVSLLLCLAAAGVPTWEAVAANSGDEVVVLYNRRSAPESRLVAEHYAERRNVPASQIIGLNLPETENISRSEFNDKLLKPLSREMESRGLIKFHDEIVPATADKPGEVLRRPFEARVRYVVLCRGVPLRITRDNDLAEASAERLPAQYRRNEASVDSDLAVLPRVGYGISVAGPISNPFLATTNAALLHPTNGILMVARLDGPDWNIARGLVDKAIQAEADGLWGRAYFDARGLTNGPYKLGDDWIRAAFQVVRRQGFESLLDERPETYAASFPMAQIALYAGWYDGKASGPFGRPRVEFMPGAIAYHLHSFSASTVRSTTEGWVGPLLAKGAAATVGFVDEPYLHLTMDVGVLFSRLIGLAFTFGEAAYASQPALSWQTTVVGDPLYQPFRRTAREQHEDLERRRSPLLEWSHLRVVNLNLMTDLPVQDLVQYLMSEPLTKQSAVLEQKLGDLRLLLGQISEGADEYSKALKLRPSPQQRIHVELALVKMFALMGRETDALDICEQFFNENPDFPELTAIYQQALSLARKAGRDDLVAKFERELTRLSPSKPSAQPSEKQQPEIK